MSTSDDSENTQTFHSFALLPIELRLTIWNLYCPDLTRRSRILDLQISGKRRPIRIRACRFLPYQTEGVRVMAAICSEARRLSLEAYPDTFEVQKRDNAYVTGIIRYNRLKDVIFLGGRSTALCAVNRPRRMDYFLSHFNSIAMTCQHPQVIMGLADIFLRWTHIKTIYVEPSIETLDISIVTIEQHYVYVGSDFWPRRQMEIYNISTPGNDKQVEWMYPNLSIDRFTPHLFFPWCAFKNDPRNLWGRAFQSWAEQNGLRLYEMVCFRHGGEPGQAIKIFGRD